MAVSAPQYQPPGSKRLDFILIAGTLGILAVIVVVAVRANRAATPPEGESCYTPLVSESECLSHCIGSCETRYTTPGGLVCQECVQLGTIKSDVNCPEGTTSDLQYCASACPNGLCMEEAFGEAETTCYACYSCPEGLHASRDDCEEACGSSCAVRGQRGKLNCWECEPDCADTCLENGFNPNGHDYTDYVREEIQKLTCVSDVKLQPKLFQVGSCVCSQQPELLVDPTVPVCTGTTCGDVTCGETVTCETGSDRQATVTCSWGGWKEISPGLFQPVISQ